MSNKNMWGDLTKLPEAKTPRLILKEQAAMLFDATSGILVPTIVEQRGNANFSRVSSFNIKVPVLNNYSLDILTLYSQSAPYPVNMTSPFGTVGSLVVKTEEEFVLQLERLLSSDALGKALKALVAEATYEDKSS